MRVNIYNEKEYAEHIIENGFTGKYMKYELKIIGKYYKTLGFGNKQIEEYIYEFCERYVVGFDKVKYYKIIDSVMNYVRKKDSKLIIINDVYIDKAEFEYINNLDVSKNAKKFCLALLTKYRLNHLIYRACKGDELETKYFSNEPTKQREVFKMANTGLKLKELHILVNELYVNGVISIADNGKLGLEFLNKINRTHEQFSIYTGNMEFIGKYYEMFLGNKRYGICKDCRIIFFGNAFGIRCKECYKKNDTKNAKFRMKKYLQQKYNNEK